MAINIIYRKASLSNQTFYLEFKTIKKLQMKKKSIFSNNPLSKCLHLLVVILISGTSLLAQNTVINGTVTDASGKALPGVSISLQGKDNGYLSDNDGKFMLSGIPSNATLQFSFVGMKTQLVPVSGRIDLNVIMQVDISSLDEVIAVGYGVRKKRDVIGSISTVKGSELTSIPGLTSVNQALQGRAAGVNVTTNSGMPGAPSTIRIRGVNSINAGSDPFYVIDGIPVYSGSGLERTNTSVGQDPLSLINPNDIESIEILKDAAATAIYGSRASNGVIIITTKSGKGATGKGSLNLNYTTGLSNLTRSPSSIGFAGTSQWFAVADMAVKNATGNASAQFQPSDILSIGRVPFTPLTRAQAEAVNSNWFDQSLRTGTFHDVNLSGTKSGDASNIFFSVNYRTDKGVLKNNDLDRVTVRLNTDFSPVQNLTLGTKLNASFSNNKRVKIGYSGAMGGGGGTVGAFEASNRSALPWLPIFDTNDPTGFWSARSGNNAANNDRRFLQDKVEQYRVLGGVFADYKIKWVKGLSVRSEMGMDFIQNNGVEWRNELITEDGKSISYDRATTLRKLNYNLLLNYAKTFGKNHSITATGGTESNISNVWLRDLEARNLSGVFPEVGSNPAEKIVMQSLQSAEDYLRSYFARADYKFMNRYILGASIRRDGSSKFTEDYRWGNFIAASAGWIISDEQFFGKLSNTINLLKLRGSYGQTGNNAIPDNSSFTLFQNTLNDRYGQASDVASGTIITNIGNSAITWEKTNSFDIGVDFGLFQNKINGSIAFYNKDVSDMLLRVALPISTGVGGNAVWANVGDMRNSGFEFNVSSVNVQGKNFKWTTDFNIATNSNKVISLNPQLDRSGKGIDFGTGTRAVSGKRLGTFFMADYAGIDPTHGVEMIWEVDIARYNTSGETVKTGRQIAATQQNVQLHRMLFDDKTTVPSLFGGLNNTFSYKNFDLNVFLTFSAGNYIYDYNLKRASYLHNGQTVLLADVTPDNIWTSGKTNALYPKQSYNSSYPGDNWDWALDDPNNPGVKGYWDNNPATKGNYNLESQNHSRFLYKGDFIRVRNISLAYNLPAVSLKKMNISGIRVFVQASNLFTFTDYPGYDPEGKTWVDGTGIPNTKTVSFGASLKF